MTTIASIVRDNFIYYPWYSTRYSFAFTLRSSCIINISPQFCYSHKPENSRNMKSTYHVIPSLTYCPLFSFSSSVFYIISSRFDEGIS